MMLHQIVRIYQRSINHPDNVILYQLLHRSGKHQLKMWVIKNTGYFIFDSDLDYIISQIYSGFIFAFILHFSRYLKLSVELIHDLLKVHHLDAANQPHDAGLASILQLP